MVETLTPTMDYPIAGQGMTAELGSRPWQNPPQFTTVEETLEYYIPRFLDSDISEQLMDVIEMGIPLTTIANAMQTGGVMQGLHTIDVGMLAIPVIIEMLAYIAEDAGIEYTMGTDKRIDDDKISDVKIALAMKKMREKLPEAVEEREEEPEVMEDTLVEPTPSGLMARRV